MLFLGGGLGGLSGFIFNAVAGRALGPSRYGEVASGVAIFTVASIPSFVIIPVLAQRSALLDARGNDGEIRRLALSFTRWLAGPCLVLLVLAALFAPFIAVFLRLSSSQSIVWLALATVVVWQLAVPRGVLQGTQRFTALSLNTASEMLMRLAGLCAFLLAGLAFLGSMMALAVGAGVAYVLAVGSLRDLWRQSYQPEFLPRMPRLSLIAAVGALGVLLLYNLDVILGKHYLEAYEAGLYGGLNKIATIIYFLTLSVSQVVFPRFVHAARSGDRSPRLLFSALGIVGFLSIVPLLLFIVAPDVVLDLLFGSAFHSASRLLPLAGFIGAGLSLNNVLVQFLVAFQDRWFLPMLLGGCCLEALLIGAFHKTAGVIVLDVSAVMMMLLVMLGIRSGLAMCRTDTPLARPR